MSNVVKGFTYVICTLIGGLGLFIDAIALISLFTTYRVFGGNITIALVLFISVLVLSSVLLAFLIFGIIGIIGLVRNRKISSLDDTK